MRSPGTIQHPDRGFSLVSVLISMVIVGVLFTLLFPAVRNAASKAKETQCLSNLRQISIASAAYSAEYRGEWPPNYGANSIFVHSLIPYLDEVPSRPAADFYRSPFICPTARSEAVDGLYMYKGVYTPARYTIPGSNRTIWYGLSYGQNVYASKEAQMYAVRNRASEFQSSQMMLYMDMEAHYTVAVGLLNAAQAPMEKRHLGRLNVAYADGAVRSLKFSDIPRNTNQMPNLFWQGRGN